MHDTKIRQRLVSLFADIDHLASDPAGQNQFVRQELELLRSRLSELEQQVADHEGHGLASAAPATAAPGLFEQDQIGYSFANDQIESLRDPAYIEGNPENALSSPLFAGGQSIGELQIAAAPERSWTSDEMQLTNAVAQQVSLQIQNLRLLAATERSRAEAEAATRQFMHEGWDAYLDAVNQDERIGFAYDQAAVTSYVEKGGPAGAVQELVTVMDEPVGALYLTPHPDRPLLASDRTLLSGVAHQIAQQVENIRLLADASRARAAAEDAIRRLTRDSWESYTEQPDKSNLGFMYDSVRVSALDGSTLPGDIVYSQPLLVRGEAVGRLAVAGGERLTPEAADLAAAIAAQASIHLETLRLSEELQKRAHELQELDRLKSAFLANMSHELRTPLNSILGFTDVILEGLDGRLTENMSNDLGLIQKNGQHLLHLINDVLDMAKIEAGRMNLNPEKFKIHEILDEVVSITSTLASEKNLALFIETDSDRSLELFADRTRLRQVMINLVNNAIKFTEKGKITIRAVGQGGSGLVIEVKDTGVGIPADKLQAVFQEFIQVDTSTTRKAGGTGLGLPISRRLVEMHGGRLWVESTGVPGEGCTFFVELPLEARLSEVVEKQVA